MGGKLTKVYDLIFGIVLGSATTLLVLGHSDAALGGALVALVLRFTIGRAALSRGVQS